MDLSSEWRYSTLMDKVFHFDSAPEPYVADAAVLTCFDQRIRQTVNKFLQRRGILRPDMMVVAGGAKTLASPRNDFERDFILEQIRMSILLHGTKCAYLICHSDCATYGGLAAYNGDVEAEARHHFQELQRAKELLKASFPDLKIECFLVNFEGVFVNGSQTSEQVA
ncbi:MAG TPA: carbonic anhydrase [Terriglobales bacterium]